MPVSVNVGRSRMRLLRDPLERADRLDRPDARLGERRRVLLQPHELVLGEHLDRRPARRGSRRRPPRAARPTTGGPPSRTDHARDDVLDTAAASGRVVLSALSRPFGVDRRARRSGTRSRRVSSSSRNSGVLSPTFADVAGTSTCHGSFPSPRRRRTVTAPRRLGFQLRHGAGSRSAAIAHRSAAGRVVGPVRRSGRSRSAARGRHPSPSRSG